MNRCMIRGGTTARTMELRGGMVDMEHTVVPMDRGACGVEATPAVSRFRTMWSRECSWEQPSGIRKRQILAIARS